MDEPHAARQLEVVDTIVVGAGPAGLTTAYKLAQSPSHSVVVLEQDPEYVGGISRTVHYRGFLFDIGGHRFFSKSAEIEALWTEMLPDGFLTRRRKSRIFFRNRFFSYPLRAIEALRNLGPLEAARCLASYARARVLPVRPPKTFHEWVTNQFGERLFQMFFRSYTEKVWGISCDRLSADWAAQRIKGLSLTTAIREAIATGPGVRLLRRRRPRNGIKTLIDSFRYPRRGPGMLWTSVRTTLESRGVEFHMGTSANGFHWSTARHMWTVRATTDAGKTETFFCRHLVSSAPMRDLVSSLVPRPLAADHVTGLSYRAFITVALMLRNASGLFDDNWIYIHDPSVKVGRVQNFGSWSKDMIPTANSSCLGLEYFCDVDDDFWGLSDEELISLARRELVQLGLALDEWVVDGRVVRQEKAYPVYDEQYRRIVDSVRSECEHLFPTLHFVGRNGMHKYNNQDHAMMTGILTAENILSGRRIHDIWLVNEDAEYHEESSPDRRAALQSIREVPISPSK